MLIIVFTGICFQQQQIAGHLPAPGLYISGPQLSNNIIRVCLAETISQRGVGQRLKVSGACLLTQLRFGAAEKCL